jgi:hypothetical protein
MREEGMFWDLELQKGGKNGTAKIYITVRF